MVAGADDIVLVEIDRDAYERLDDEEIWVRYEEDRHLLLRVKEFEDRPPEQDDRPVRGVN